MQPIFDRLRSRRGATLLIAMVFFLLCSFVGGTVLAAATSNGGRLAALKNSRQAYLSQRSAAQLLQKQLTMADGTKNQLTVTDETTTTTVTTTGSGTSVTTTTSHVLTFTAPAGAVGVQRVLYEAAVRRYLEEKGIGYGESISFTNFEFGGLRSSLSDFCPMEGVCSVNVSEGAGTLEELDARYLCASGAQDTLASFTLVLSDSAGGESQLSLYLKAGVTPGEVFSITDTQTVGNTRTEKKIDTQTTVIAWSDPVIRKGGAI